MNSKSPTPVTAYAVMSNRNRPDIDTIRSSESLARMVGSQWYVQPVNVVPVTILPTEQHEAMVAVVKAAKVVVAETESLEDANGLIRAICELEEALAVLKEQAEEKPTPTVSDEWEILKRLAAGDRIHFSQDGEMAWFICGDKALVGGLSGLRTKGYLLRKGDDKENYRGGGEYDTISEAGLAALKEQEHG